MKFKINTLVMLSCLCLSFFGGLISLPHTASALSTAEIKQCSTDFDGKRTGQGVNADDKLDTDKYKKSNCDKSKKGPCVAAVASQGATINCTVPKSDDANPDSSSATDCSSAKGLEPSTVSNGNGGTTSLDTSCTYTAAADPALKACDTAGSCDFIAKYVNPAIEVFTAIAGLAITIAIVYGGILYSASSGDAGQVSKAKNIIRNAVLSLLGFIFLLSFLQWLVPGGLFHK